MKTNWKKHVGRRALRRECRLLALLVALAALLSACQPTPAEEAVVNRGDGTLEERISAPARAPGGYDCPARWEQTVSLKNLDIVFDADVETGGGDVYPVLTMERAAFTAEDVFALIGGLFPGAVELRCNAYSREEVRFDIQMVQRGQFSDVDDETGEITWTPYEDEQEQLSALNELLAQCPEQDSFAPLTQEDIRLDGTQQVLRTSDGRLFYLTATEGSIVFRSSRTGDVQTESLVWGSGGYAGERPHALTGVTIEEADAQAYAQELLERCAPLAEFAVAAAEKARILTNVPEGFFIPSEGYLMELGRAAGACLPFNYGSYSTDNRLRAQAAGEEAYIESWRSDTIQLYVDEYGLSHFAWYSPSTVARTANENVELLPFDEVQTRIADMFRYCFSWADESARFSEIRISRVVLSCAAVRMANRPDEAFLCPTWMVVYQNDVEAAMHRGNYVLMINAVDGSRVTKHGFLS